LFIIVDIYLSDVYALFLFGLLWHSVSGCFLVITPVRLSVSFLSLSYIFFMCSLYFFENAQKIKTWPLWIGWFFSMPHFALRWIYTGGVNIITCWFPAVYLVTMIAFDHYCIHMSIVVRNDVHYFIFKGLNGRKLPTHFLPDKSVTHDSFVYMKNVLTYLPIVNV
jgi:hypothetical protein